MYKKVLLINALLVSISFFSQEVKFNSVLKNIASELKTVQNSKSTFNQSIISENPGVVLLKSTETTTKGKSEEILYQLNLSDIDINTIRPVTSKDVIMVQMIVKNNQKMIKQTIDNEKIRYENKAYILAHNIDNARILTDYLKEIIPISNEITENRLSLDNYEDRLNWLVKNVVNVSIIDVNYNQKLSLSTDVPGNVTIDNTSIKNKSSETQRLQFNLSNINPNTIFFKSKGSEFILSLETKRKLKTIKLFENQEQKNYINGFDIICNDVENARDLQRVFKEIIPLAQKEFDNSFPKILGLEQGIEIINKKIETITTDKTTTQQSFSKNSVTTFSKKEIDAKRQKEFTFNFNFIDINKDDIEVDIKGTEVLLLLKTKSKNKFIKEVENNELQNYTNEIEIVCNSIEDAYIIKNIFTDIVGLSEKTKEETYRFSNLTKGVEVLKKNIFGVNIDKYTYEQNIELIENSENKILKFTSVKVSDKKSEENIQEFNLSDINAKSLEIDVSGKKVMVNFTTNYQEKIIKTYIDGEIKSYTNEVTIFCSDIENARNIKNVISSLIAVNQ